MDVESLQKSGRRRSGCLDAFLIASITFLFVAVAAVTVVGTMVVMALKSRLDSPTHYQQVETSHLTGDLPSSGYKVNRMTAFTVHEKKESLVLLRPMFCAHFNPLHLFFLFCEQMQNFVYLQAASGMSIFICYHRQTTHMFEDRVTKYVLIS